MDKAAAERSRQRVVDVLRARVQAERVELVESLQRRNDDKRSLVDSALAMIAAMDNRSHGGEQQPPADPRSRSPLLPLLPLPSSPDAVHIPPSVQPMQNEDDGEDAAARDGRGDALELVHVQATFHPDASNGAEREGWWDIRAVVRTGEGSGDIGSVSLSIVPALQSTSVRRPPHPSSRDSTRRLPPTHFLLTSAVLTLCVGCVSW